jgi:MFS family permease
MSAVFGRQQLLVASLVFFTVGTILCAVATDFTLMLAGRCIQGVGGGGEKIHVPIERDSTDIVPTPSRHNNPYSSHLLRHRAAPAEIQVFPVGTGCVVYRHGRRTRPRRRSSRKGIMAVVLPYQLPILRHWVGRRGLHRPTEPRR